MRDFIENFFQFLTDNAFYVIFLSISLILLLLLPFSIIGLYKSRKFSFNKSGIATPRNPWKHAIHLLSIIAIMIAGILPAILLLDYFGEYFRPFGEGQNRSLQAVVLALSASLATLGWGIASYYSRKFSRISNTYAALTDFRFSNSFDKHRANFYAYSDLFEEYDIQFVENTTKYKVEHSSFQSQQGKYLVFDLPNLKELLNEQDDFNYIESANESFKYPTLDSIQFIANFYEFIALGIKLENLDEELLKLTLRGLFIRFYIRVQVFILEDRQFDHTGNSTRATYENISDLANRWYNPQLDKGGLISTKQFIEMRKKYKNNTLIQEKSSDILKRKS